MPYKILIYDVIDEQVAKNMDEAYEIIDNEYRIKGKLCKPVRITNEEYDLLKDKKNDR